MERTNSKERGVIGTLKEGTLASVEEAFQNETLRPIIKMQHDLLIAHLKNYLMVNKCIFCDLSENDQIIFVKKAFQKNVQLRHELRGLIIGHFTESEYKVYTEMLKEINKRILNIIEERILNSLNELV